MRTLPHDAEAIVTFLRTEDGGRSTPVYSGYRGQFHYDGMDWDAVQSYPASGAAHPGETTRVILSFVSPEAHIGKLSVGTPFLVREGHKIVAYGAISALVELEDSARERLSGQPIPPTDG